MDYSSRGDRLLLKYFDKKKYKGFVCQLMTSTFEIKLRLNFVVFNSKFLQMPYTVFYGEYNYENTRNNKKTFT